MYQDVLSTAGVQIEVKKDWGKLSANELVCQDSRTPGRVKILGHDSRCTTHSTSDYITLRLRHRALVLLYDLYKLGLTLESKGKRDKSSAANFGNVSL